MQLCSFFCASGDFWFFARSLLYLECILSLYICRVQYCKKAEPGLVRNKIQNRFSISIFPTHEYCQRCDAQQKSWWIVIGNKRRGFTILVLEDLTWINSEGFSLCNVSDLVGNNKLHLTFLSSMLGNSRISAFIVQLFNLSTSQLI